MYEPSEGFLVDWSNNKRDANIICLLFLQFVRYGTTIITYKLKGYILLQHQGCTYYDVKLHRPTDRSGS